jgi:cyclophilin family peptidyl-prolyl cis-trans isomerase
VPDFVVQFGISGDPATNKKWETPIKDDKVIQSNVAGTIVYATAGPNTRTTQLFINYIDNSRLDSMGFSPFGTVISGMETAKKIFNPTPGNTGGVDQGEYTSKGNDWIKAKYPKINFITNATIL